MHEKPCCHALWEEGAHAPDRVESCEVWRQLSREAHAIVEAASILRKEEILRHEQDRLTEQLAVMGVAGIAGIGRDSRVLQGLGKKDRLWTRRYYEREAVSRALGNWLQMGAVRPVFSWRYALDKGGFVEAGSDAQPVIAPEGELVNEYGPPVRPNLFSFIAVQLLFWVAGCRKLGQCCACGQFYIPNRAVTSAENNPRTFCGACKTRGVDSRLRMERKRARDRAQTKAR
jgi:hypothetical protein